MTSPLFGGNALLSSFVEGIGRNLFLYKGHDIFEAVLACFLSLNVRREENNFVYAPQMPIHIRDLMAQYAVRFTTNTKADNKYVIFNDDFNDQACAELETDQIMLVGNGANPNGEIAVSFSRELPIDGAFIDHISAKVFTCAPFSPALMLTGRYRALVTTNWRWHAMAGMVGVPSVLLSGPKYPLWVQKLPGHQIDTLVDEKASLKACRCSRIALCHAKMAQAKPCMTTANWQELKGSVVNLLQSA
jgi:hypothetical protein